MEDEIKTNPLLALLTTLCGHVGQSINPADRANLENDLAAATEYVNLSSTPVIDLVSEPDVPVSDDGYSK